MKKTRKKYGMILCVLLSFMFLCFGCGQEEDTVFLEQKEEVQEEAEKVKKEEPTEKKTDNQPQQICVFVCGKVKNPGVYYLNFNARVYEAVEAAGGFLEEADTGWLNQAEILSDGAKIQIYSREETQKLQEEGVSEENSKINEESTKEEAGKVNLNTASLEELQTVPGIGAAKASAIIEYRETQGSFKSTEEIQNVPGIKGKTFEKIQPYITAG